MSEHERRGIEERRRQQFKVEITSATYPGEPGEICLMITHNGTQWTSMDLTPIERLKVIRALMMEGL